MSSKQLAISIRGLSKAYIISHNSAKVSTLYQALSQWLRRPFRRVERETFWALKDFSLDIDQGDVVGVIGRNGSGKSTLLKILSRIVTPTTGEVDLYGRIGSLLEVGTGFHPELTGRENIFLNGSILGMKRTEIQRQFDAIVDFAEVDRFLDTPVKRYSSGMYVRLAFAVAAHLNPEILIVDEVLAVGDAAFQKKCLGKMGEVSTRQGRTILFVSHNMSAVTSLCNKAVWLQGGCIRDVGLAREIVQRYAAQTIAKASRYADLGNFERNGHFGKQLRMLSLEWLEGLPLRHSEAVRVRIEFEVLADVQEVTMGLGFSTTEGERLLTYETDYQEGFRPNLRAGGRIHVQLTIDELPLAPGTYALDIGSRSGDNYGLDYLPAFCQVEVVSGRRTPVSIARPGANVRLRSDWTWTLNDIAHNGGEGNQIARCG